MSEYDDILNSGEAASAVAEGGVGGSRDPGPAGSPANPAPPSSPVSLDVEGIPLTAKKGKAKSEVRKSGACPRWMFHRKGVYCKACGRTG